jgi:hypothetical protein
MFKYLAGAVLGVTAIVAWSYAGAGVGDLTAAEVRAVEGALRQGRHDLGAEIREPVLKKPDSMGFIVCGWFVSSGTSSPFGAQPFIGLLSDDGTFAVASVGATEGEKGAVRVSTAE